MDGRMWLPVLFCCCLLMSAMFSASETALISLGKVRLRKMVDDKVKNSVLIAKLLEDPDKLLVAILIGNNLVNIAASAIITDIALKIFGDSGLAIATGVATFLILVFSEITPKTYARAQNERVATLFAKPIYAICWFATPAVFLFDKACTFILFLLGAAGDNVCPTVTEAEIITMVNISHEEGLLELEEKKMIKNVFAFGDRDIGNIMTPRVNVVSIDTSDDYESVYNVIKENGYTRIPVFQDDTEEIVGILNVKDLILAGTAPSEFKIENIMRKPHFVYEFNNTAKVFSSMRKNNIPMSIVLDEYGLMAGIVTIEDLIEEIIGDITDEYDFNETQHTEINKGEYLVDGSMSLGDFNDLTGTNIESDNFDSIGGFVLGKLGDVPSEGQFVEYENILLTIESTENNRILSLHVKIN